MDARYARPDQALAGATETILTAGCRLKTTERLAALDFHNSPSEPFPSTTRNVRLFMSSFRGRAVQLTSHGSKESGAFCFCRRILDRDSSRGFSPSSTMAVSS